MRTHALSQKRQAEKLALEEELSEIPRALNVIVSANTTNHNLAPLMWLRNHKYPWDMATDCIDSQIVDKVLEVWRNRKNIKKTMKVMNPDDESFTPVAIVSELLQTMECTSFNQFVEKASGERTPFQEGELFNPLTGRFEKDRDSAEFRSFTEFIERSITPFQNQSPRR